MFSQLPVCGGEKFFYRLSGENKYFTAQNRLSYKNSQLKTLNLNNLISIPKGSLRSQ